MSIQSEINRIGGNVQDALAAIAGKGVTIPAGANSDNLATLIGQIGKRLPSGYTELQYVYSTSSGQQYIDTGFVPTLNTRLECEFSLTAAENTNMAIFGVQNTGQFSFRQYSRTVFRTNGGNNVDFSVVTPDAARHIVVKSMTGTILDYEGKTTTAPSSITNNLFLFALDNAGTASQFAKMSLYWLKIYSGATLVRDFLPCKNSGNVAGLYDRVNDVFYKSKSNSNLAAGPVV